MKKLRTVFQKTDDPKIVRPMDDTESKLMVNILLTGKKTGADAVAGKDLEAKFGDNPPAQIMIPVKRLAIHGPDLMFVPDVVIFVAITSRNPADAVMGAYALFRATVERGQAIDMDYLAGELIPWGLATEEFKKELWDEQKIPLEERSHPASDNYLDTAEAWAIEKETAVG